MEELPLEIPLTTSIATPITTAQRTYRRSAKRATTEKPPVKQDSAVLMQKLGIKRSKDGTLLFPCSVTPEQQAQVRAALKR